MSNIPQFKYRMEDVECSYCTEYDKLRNCCKQRICPWLAERIEAGAVDYEAAVLESFPYDSLHKLRTAIRLFHGSLWLDEEHQRRMEGLKAREGYRKRRDTPGYFAAMYLFTSNAGLLKRTEVCFHWGGIDFKFANLKNISTHDYTLFCAAQDIYANGDKVALSDLSCEEVVDTTAFGLIVNALLIARYGRAALELQQKKS